MWGIKYTWRKKKKKKKHVGEEKNKERKRDSKERPESLSSTNAFLIQDYVAFWRIATYERPAAHAFSLSGSSKPYIECLDFSYHSSVILYSTVNRSTYTVSSRLYTVGWTSILYKSQRIVDRTRMSFIQIYILDKFIIIYFSSYTALPQLLLSLWFRLFYLFSPFVNKA